MGIMGARAIASGGRSTRLLVAPRLFPGRGQAANTQAQCKVRPLPVALAGTFPLPVRRVPQACQWPAPGCARRVRLQRTASPECRAPSPPGHCRTRMQPTELAPGQSASHGTGRRSSSAQLEGGAAVTAAEWSLSGSWRICSAAYSVEVQDHS